MPRCIVKCCIYNKSVNYNRDKAKVHLFRFPKDEKRMESWVAALNLRKEDIFQYSNVCQFHFDEKSYDFDKSPFALHLKPNAVPMFVKEDVNETPTTSQLMISADPFSPKSSSTDTLTVDYDPRPSTSSGFCEDKSFPELPSRSFVSMGFSKLKTPPTSPTLKDSLNSVTKDSITCESCFDSLGSHGSFVENCPEVQKKYESTDTPPYIKTEGIEIKLEDVHEVQRIYKSRDSYIKSEEIKIKLEDDQDAQETYKYIDKPSYIKFEEINIKLENNRDVQEEYKNVKIKTEEGDHDGDSQSHSFDEETIDKKQNHISENIAETNNEYTLEHEAKFQINKCETNNRYKRKSEDDFKHIIKMYKCDTCDYETKRKSDLKGHQLSHKDPSEILMYKCDICTYETKYKKSLKNHQLTHKDLSLIEMCKCDICGHETKTKGEMKSHQLVHKHPSEVQMYKCDACTYETKYKGRLKVHQLTHKDPSETQIYKCDRCSFETKLKYNLKLHQLIHKDPSEIPMYKCDACDYEAKRKGDLKSHLLTHKDASEIEMYKCDRCDYETKRKGDLKVHELLHEDPLGMEIF